MNPVVHFESPYDDAARAVRFYTAVFGWETHDLGPDMGNYIIATTAKADVKPGAPAGAVDGGLFPRMSEGPAKHPTVVIAVRNMARALRAIREAGGEVLGDPVQIQGVGRYASFTDSEGNRLSLLEPAPRSTLQ
ncbi:MAG: VOC family protein [Pseudomonadota bacterium]